MIDEYDQLPESLKGKWFTFLTHFACCRSSFLNFNCSGINGHQKQRKCSQIVQNECEISLPTKENFVQGKREIVF